MNTIPKHWKEFLPPGREISGMLKEMAATISHTPDKVSHLYLVGDGGIVLVRNKRDTLLSGKAKPAGWGIPTETVRCEKEIQETPFQAVERVVEDEINLFGTVTEINPTPFRVYVTRSETGPLTHFVFAGKMESFTDIPKQIIDPSAEVDRAIMIHPKNILVSHDGQPFIIYEEVPQTVYKSHVGLINFMSEKIGVTLS